VTELFRQSAGKRLVYRPLANAKEFHRVGIARIEKCDMTPAGKKFCKASWQASAVVKPSSPQIEP